MAAERQTLAHWTGLAAIGVEGAEEMANAQRAMIIQLEQGAAAADSLGDSFDGLMDNVDMNKDLQIQLLVGS